MDLSGLTRDDLLRLQRTIEQIERLAPKTTAMFPFRRKDRLPTVGDLSLEQLRALPSEPSHLEWVTKQAFGREYRVLQVWLLGCRRPLRWKEDEGIWV